VPSRASVGIGNLGDPVDLGNLGNVGDLGENAAGGAGTAESTAAAGGGDGGVCVEGIASLRWHYPGQVLRVARASAPGSQPRGSPSCRDVTAIQPAALAAAPEW